MPGTSLRGPWRKLAIASLVAVLATVTAACNGDAGSAASGAREPIEKIAPPAGKSWADLVEKTADGGYRMGNPDAPIKLVEFASLTCPHCAHFSEESSPELRESFVESGRVSYEFRNFILNPIDLAMTMVVRCGTPESFFALVDQTFDHQDQLIENWSQAGEAAAQAAINQPPEARYQAIAELAGLPEFYASRGIAIDQANECLAQGDAAEALVAATTKQGEEYGITGTPAFRINGETLGANTWAEVKAQLETLGAR